MFEGKAIGLDPRIHFAKKGNIYIYLKCENEGIFGVSNRQNPKKKRKRVMKIARFLCLVPIESQKYECMLKFILRVCGVT
jgi:hypothetical protein